MQIKTNVYDHGQILVNPSSGGKEVMCDDGGICRRYDGAVISNSRMLSYTLTLLVEWVTSQKANLNFQIQIDDR